MSVRAATDSDEEQNRVPAAQKKRGRKGNFSSPRPLPPPGGNASGGADGADPRTGTRRRREEGRERE